MTITATILALATLTVTASSAPLGVSAAQALDLTGKWVGNDGGAYYIRQVGNDVYWYGESGEGGGAFSNVFSGQVGSGNIITGHWADVPKGGTRGSGTMGIRIDNPKHLVRISQTGDGFGASEWTLP